MRKIWSYLLLIFLSVNLFACQNSSTLKQDSPLSGISSLQSSTKLIEVAPPKVIQQLRQSLEKYQPQVEIISPKADSTVIDTKATVKLKVKDLPIFKDSQLNLGPHLNLIVDNQPLKEIYDLEQEIVLEDLAPGTHTIRAFAVRPWNESFKNEGAYAQTTFHVLTKTKDNAPLSSLPLLSYNSPTGDVSTESILLDFYLTNAPLHLVAQQQSEDEINDWRIKVTVNGESFLLDTWQPVYLKGLERGKNWIQLEFIDELGNNIDNAFNNTVRVINYDPKTSDTLTKLFKGELSKELALGIVQPNYQSPTTSITQEESNPTPEETITQEESNPTPEKTVTQEESNPTPEETVTQEKPISTSIETTLQPPVDKVEDSLETDKKSNVLPSTPEISTPITKEAKEPLVKEIPTRESSELKTQLVEPKENLEINSSPSTSVNSSPTNIPIEEDNQKSEALKKIETTPSNSIETIPSDRKELTPSQPKWLQDILTKITKVKISFE
jgi:hypothetical protein